MSSELKKPYFIPNPEVIGEHIFTFDGKKTYNLFRDYPKKLTPEEKQLFDETFPFWANFFRTDDDEQKGDKMTIGNTEPHLAHYGVVGMRWGVRHDRPKAYQKASKKADKLTQKASRKEEKAGTARDKARKSRYGITSTGRAIWENRQTKAGRLTRKADKATRKAEDWLKAMHEAFGEIKLDDIK